MKPWTVTPVQSALTGKWHIVIQAGNNEITLDGEPYTGSRSKVVKFAQRVREAGLQGFVIGQAVPAPKPRTPSHRPDQTIEDLHNKGDV